MRWLRLVFAVPVLALLAVVGYQNLITLPRMTQAMGKPQLLPSVMVNVSTRGTEVPEVTARKGGAFVVYVRIPPQAGYSQYTAALYNPENKLEWSLPIPVNAGQDTYLVEVPAANRESGKYTLNIQGVTATGQSTPVGFPAAFEVKMEN